MIKIIYFRQQIKILNNNVYMLQRRYINYILALFSKAELVLRREFVTDICIIA